MSDYTGIVAKIDEEQRLVFGWAYKTHDADGRTIIDKQGDFIRPDTLEKSAYDYVLKSRQADVMHLQEPIATMVESMVLTPEKVEKMGLPSTTPLGWWVGFKIHDETVWKSRDGLKMFSIGGRGIRKSVELGDDE